MARSVLAWLVLLVVMMGNGIFRVLVLQPRLGEPAARQVACLSGIALLLATSAVLVGRLGRHGSRELLGVGLLWLLLTVAFELLFGRFGTGASWEAMLAEYDLPHGRLWPLVLLTTLLAPWLWGRVLRHTSS